jgi:membrane-associated phospholipid phosphatase
MNIIKIISIRIIVGAMCLIMHAAPLYAQSQSKNVRDLKYDLRLDLAVTGITAAGFIGTTLLEKQLAPDSCHWCGVNAFDDWGHRNLTWSNTNAANVSSHVAAFVLAPMVSFGLDALAAHDSEALSGFPVDALIIAEATSIAAMFTQIIKFSSGRERPSAHYLPPAEKVGRSASDDNLSFYSNHTSIAFALAVSGGTVATMRGYRLAPLIWGAGLAVAATTGYLRVAADKHYLTDVIAGAVMGSAFGFCIPYFFHQPKESSEHRVMVSAMPLGSGGILSISGTL